MPWLPAVIAGAAIIKAITPKPPKININVPDPVPPPEVAEIAPEITNPVAPPAAPAPTVLGTSPTGTAPVPAPVNPYQPISPGSGFTASKSSVIGGAQSSGVRTSPGGLSPIQENRRRRSVLGTL